MAYESQRRARSVTYDGGTFQIDGKRIFILSGSVHYPRVHPSRWSRIFDTFREASLNTIETYVFWGEHQTMPQLGSIALEPLQELPQTYDFQGRRDLFGFLEAAHRAGLYVILRIGPYVCAEVSYGGFPFALRDLPGMQFRTTNEPFQREVAKWLRHLGKELHARKLMAPEGGPVILFQLENEYQMVAGAYGQDGMKYLQWCADLQHELQLCVPAIMCYGAADGAVETINSFYAHELVDNLRQERPDQPPVWTECWTGWYDVWGVPHHSRPTSDLLAAVARFCAVGGAGVNYYMWHGGTNFGRTPMYLQATSYDYDAPIDEFCNATTKSKRISALHRVLLDHYVPKLFARSDTSRKEIGFETPGKQHLTDSVSYYQWGPDLAFVCNDSAADQALDIHIPASNLVIQLMPPGSVQIVKPDQAIVLFDTHANASTVPLSRKLVAVQTKPKAYRWLMRKEPLVRFGQGKMVESLLSRPHQIAEVPVEQLKLTSDASDYCFYSANFQWSPEPGAVKQAYQAASNLTFSFEAWDFAYLFVNDVAVGQSAEPLWEDRKRNRWNDYPTAPGFQQNITVRSESLPQSARESDCFTVTILVCSLGLVKGDWQLGDGPSANMLQEKKGLLSDVTVSGPPMSNQDAVAATRISGWLAVGGLTGEAESWYSRRSPNSFVGLVENAAESSPLVWYETTIDVTDGLSETWVLDLGGMGKGLLWANGYLIGRYWNIAGTRPRNGFLDDSPIVLDAAGSQTQRYYHIPGWIVKPTSSPTLRITLFEERSHSPKDTAVHLFCVC